MPNTNEAICLVEIFRFGRGVVGASLAAPLAVMGRTLRGTGRDSKRAPTLTPFPQATYHPSLARGVLDPAPGQIRKPPSASVPCAAEGTQDMNDETTALPATDVGAPQDEQATQPVAEEPTSRAVAIQ